jgi:CBS-domain-containing membrane protein
MIESSNRVFLRDGSHVQRVIRSEEDSGGCARVPTIADLVPVVDVMTRNVTCTARDLRVDTLAQLMVRNHIGCVPVIDAGRLVGMVTKLDVVERLLTTGFAVESITVEDVMMPLARSLGPRDTVAHAAALMAREDLHHVPILDEGQLIGIVSSMDIVRWLADNDGFVEKQA